MAERKDYVAVIYNEQDRPYTAYPDQLCQYLFERYAMKPHARLLDLGCGRGEFLRGFVRCGMEAFGADQSLLAKKINPEAEIRQADFSSTTIPYDDNSFSYVFSKSVLEHFYYPENLVAEINRVLQPGGLVITMVPDWESVYRMFYDDYTHRTPFTQTSLKDFLLINGFDQVSCEKFRQLPFLWRRPWLKFSANIIDWLCPDSLKKYHKVIRFSKEGMLLASATKPTGDQT